MWRKDGRIDVNVNICMYITARKFAVNGKTILLPSLHHQKSLACLDLHALDSFERELITLTIRGIPQGG